MATAPTAGGWQDVILNGSGTLANASAGCSGLVSGTFTLNNFDLKVKASGGAIDFRPPAPTSGGPVAAVEVNGTGSAASEPVHGIYRTGNYEHRGSTYSCSAGTAAGTVNRGPRPATGVHDLVLTTFDLACSSPIGTGSPPYLNKWSIGPGCAIEVDLPDTPNIQGNTASVHDGTVDTGTAIDYGPVAGRASVVGECLTYTGLFGLCFAQASGSVSASFDEAIKTVGGVNYQELTLNGSGLSYTTQTGGCSGQMTGPIKFNSIKFDVQVSPGTTTGIDFRQSP